MTREFIFIRYAKRPDPAVSNKIFSYVTPNTKPLFTTLPEVLITMFKSDENIDVMRAGFDTLGIKFDIIEKKSASNGVAVDTDFVETDDQATLQDLKNKLMAALEAEEFEKAAKLRDQIDAIENTSESVATGMITSINEFKKQLAVNKKVNESTESILRIFKACVEKLKEEDPRRLQEFNDDWNKCMEDSENDRLTDIYYNIGEIMDDFNLEELRTMLSKSLHSGKNNIQEKQLISASAKPKHGKMHQVLGIPEDKEIKDVYTSGRKLAEDLVAKVGRKEAFSMLAFVANINKEEDIYDVALRAVKNVNESVQSDISKMSASDILDVFKDTAARDHRTTFYDMKNFNNDGKIITFDGRMKGVFMEMTEPISASWRILHHAFPKDSVKITFNPDKSLHFVITKDDGMKQMRNFHKNK
jgi:hypothetical protein